MAKKKVEETINLDSILFKCRDILRKARNSGSFFEKRDMMLTLVFLRFIGEKFDDGIEVLRQKLIEMGLDPDDEEIRAAFFDDATFTDGTYNLPVEARWSNIINTPAPKLNVALDTALHSIAASSSQLKGCFIEGTFTTRNLAPNDIKQLVDEVNKITHKAFGVEKDLIGRVYAPQSHIQTRVSSPLWHQNAPTRTIPAKQEAMPSNAWLPVFEPGAGQCPCPESRGGALWPTALC